MRRTKRVIYLRNERERLSSAGSRLDNRIYEVHSGAVSANEVAGNGLRTLRVLSESSNALLRVEPRITSSLI